MGPYIGGQYAGVPTGCKVTQVHMISRHGERYPTTHMGSRIKIFAQNVSEKKGFSKSLAFLNDWRYDDWIYSPEDQLEQETLTGPAAGSRRMFSMGNELRTRYSDLWSFRDQSQEVKVWSSNSKRVIHSARYFSAGFFGINNAVAVEIIPETNERWGNTLTTTYVPSLSAECG
jgi:acid phosphatase